MKRYLFFMLIAMLASGPTLPSSNVSSAKASNSYAFQNDGTVNITTTSTLTNWGPGTLTNNSDGGLYNYGTVRLARCAGTDGNLLIFIINGGGDYHQLGTGIFDEQISSTGNGLLNVTGSVLLDSGAALNIDLFNGLDPVNGMSFIIMNYGSESGIFNLADPFFNNGLQQWIITYGDGNNEIVLTAESTAPETTTLEPCTLLLVGSAALLGLGRRYVTKKRV